MFDYSLYLVTDRSLSLGRETVNIVRAAIAGGVTCVQLREKQCSAREFIAEARALKTLLAAASPKIPLIINDRLDVALAIGADGIHLGQTDMPLADARRLAGSSLIIGIRAAVALPLVGIGGIHQENAGAVIRAGADGVAVVSAIVAAACPRNAATKLKLQIQSAR